MDGGAGLAVRRAEAAARAAGLAADLDRMIEASVGANADDEHDPEGATVAFERAQLAALLVEARQRIVELDAALARHSAGTYGRCETCGEPIPPERLAARPASTTCVRCATPGASRS
jgi:DnaK suppressor protein